MCLEPLMNLQEDRCSPKEKTFNTLAIRSEVDVSYGIDTDRVAELNNFTKKG